MLNNAMSVVILAAGKGTRMYSDLPKVLHTLAGKAMVQHVIDAANELGAAHVHLVYGHGGDLLKQALKDDNLNWVLQAEQLGTGHAMQQAAPKPQERRKPETFKRETPKVGRNDPCPCGSGKKYKNCCGKNAVS